MQFLHYFYKRRKIMKILIGALIGGGIGFALGYWGKCSSGACPLTNNPYIVAVIGVILGIIIASK